MEVFVEFDQTVHRVARLDIDKTEFLAWLGLDHDDYSLSDIEMFVKSSETLAQDLDEGVITYSDQLESAQITGVHE